MFYNIFGWFVFYFQKLIYAIMLGYMQKVNHFWAQIKKKPKCELERFCPEPFNYCHFKSLRSINYQKIKLAWMDHKFIEKSKIKVWCSDVLWRTFWSFHINGGRMNETMEDLWGPLCSRHCHWELLPYLPQNSVVKRVWNLWIHLCINNIALPSLY